jgi:hypothetical protein
MPFTRPKASQIDFDVTNITDPLIRLNSGESGSADKDAGIVIERGSDTNAALIYDESANQFAVINTNETGTTAGNVTIASYADLKVNAIYGDGSNLTNIPAPTSATSLAGTDTNALLTLTTTEDSSSAGPVIDLKRNSASPADADYLGQIKFKGENEADQEVVYAKITGKILDASDGTEDGLIEFANRKAGSNVITARLRSDSFQLLNSTNLSVAGTSDFSGDTSHGDNVLATFGDGTDFTIHHDGNNNIIRATNGHNTWIQTDGNLALTKKYATEYFAIFYADAGVELRHNNIKKFETTANGITVTGDVTTTADIELGHASDTTIARSSAGVVTIEGNIILTTGNSDAPATTTDSGDADFVLIDDGGTMKKITTSNLGIGTGGGATVSQDNSSNTDFNIYFASTTSGSLTAVKYDGGTLTFNPSSETLAVTNVTGTSSAAKYADVAENYIADADYEPGTVLVFGGKYECTICNTLQNKRIIGIVSEKPAYLMNKDLDADHVATVALLGRVPAKVIGEIRKGDMMISSNEPGHCQAWKEESNPPSGTVLGKALEDKTGRGTGVIQVLIGRL